ncbi:uncharacterized protein LOC136026436 isoform X2 [Artemia franciscana]|uniref:uncharacterized protein LOC136026436 isoform X2 n=1 Tax=Artemia franciscana TaxID=6661 RepID=UPI0032DB0A18
MVYLGSHFNVGRSEVVLSSTSDSSISRSSSNSSSCSDLNPPVQQLTSKGVVFQNKRTPTGLPAASTRPMATKARNLGHATSIVTCTAAKTHEGA